MNLNFTNLFLNFRTLWHFILFLPTTLKKELTMTAIHEPVNLGDLLKYEESALRYSRDVATVAAGDVGFALGIVDRPTASVGIAAGGFVTGPDCDWRAYPHASPVPVKSFIDALAWRVFYQSGRLWPVPHKLC